MQDYSVWYLWGCNYIAGEWQKHRIDIAVSNPTTRNDMPLGVGAIPSSSKEEMDRAIMAANEAFNIWGNNSKWSWVKRAELVDHWVQLIKAHKESIAVLMVKECGKTINECRADVEEGIHMLQYCAGRGRQPIGYKIASEIATKEAETYLMPKGVCTVITPWNFPLAIPTWLIGPAIVCGNTVVFKPSEETPFTAQYLIDLFDLATQKFGNVPPGVINLIHGNGNAGEYLVRHPNTIGQLFTGSYEVGSKIKKIVADSYDKFAVCEMGGKNSLIVMDDADLKLAVNAAIISAYKTTHQRCVSPDMIIVHKNIESQFTAEFVRKSQQVKFGNPFDETVFAGPLINRKAVEKYASYITRATKQCDETLMIDHPDLDTNFVKPSIFRTQYKPDLTVLQEEFFTPVIIIIPVQNFEEALFVANSTKYGLSMALITQDFRKMREFKIRGKAGLKYVNLPTIGAEVHLPFGGLKRSGTGMPSAAWLFNYLCYETAFTVNYSQEIQMAQGLSAQI